MRRESAGCRGVPPECRGKGGGYLGDVMCLLGVMRCGGAGVMRRWAMERFGSWWFQVCDGLRLRWTIVGETARNRKGAAGGRSRRGGGPHLLRLQVPAMFLGFNSGLIVASEHDHKLPSPYTPAKSCGAAYLSPLQKLRLPLLHQSYLPYGPWDNRADSAQQKHSLSRLWHWDWKSAGIFFLPAIDNA
jgi:hypothetical protein